jgi:hypothetical protein
MIAEGEDQVVIGDTGTSTLNIPNDSAPTVLTLPYGRQVSTYFAPYPTAVPPVFLVDSPASALSSAASLLAVISLFLNPSISPARRRTRFDSSHVQKRSELQRISNTKTASMIDHNRKLPSESLPRPCRGGQKKVLTITTADAPIDDEVS